MIVKQLTSIYPQNANLNYDYSIKWFTDIKLTVKMHGFQISPKAITGFTHVLPKITPSKILNS